MPGQHFVIRTEGLTRLTRELLAMGADVEDLKDVFSDLAARGARIAADAAPVRTGTLSGDIRGNRARNKAVVTAGRSSVPYAGPINYGWPAHNIAPALFMQAVDTQLGPTAPRLIEDSLNDLIRRRGLG